MKKKDKLIQAHFDALPALLEPLIKAKHEHKNITWQELAKILREWDKARKI